MRVSTFEQNTQRQLDQVPIDRIFTDKASGKDAQRPELDSLLAFVRHGYSIKDLVEQFDSKAGKIKALFNNTLVATRTAALPI